MDLNSRQGMGAMLSKALLLHAWADDHSVDLRLTSSNPLYTADGDDVLARYFARPLPSSPVRPLGARALAQLMRGIPRHLDLARASAIFAREFRPRPELQARIAEGAAGTERFDLTIHFRGTDKYLESGRIDFDRMLAEAGIALAPIEAPRVFLATDDADFATAVRGQFPHVRFTSYELGQVEPGQARHFSDLSPGDKAVEALGNVFLLGRAPLCIRTASYLSAVAAIANPAMRTVTVNKTRSRRSPFPEAELLEREARGRP